MRLVRLLQTRMKSGRRTAIARRSLAAVAHACHAIGAGCGWLRRLANAPHHPEARHERTPPECLFEYRGAPNAPPQRDGRAGPALAGGAEGSERNGVVLDLRSDWGFESMRVR